MRAFSPFAQGRQGHIPSLSHVNTFGMRRILTKVLAKRRSKSQLIFLNNMGWSEIPEGWVDCPNSGLGIIADRFVVFKTPLSTRYDNKIDKSRYWNPSSVFQNFEQQNIQIALWIDLTNTDRYFTKDDVEKRGVKYLKLKVGGGGEPPSPSNIIVFNTHCQQFLADNPTGIIGVHCTHGFNRTGFLICSFLVQMAEKSIEEALTEFSRVRPPGIYRQKYVSILWKRFSATEQEPSVQEPAWSHRAIPNNIHRNTRFDNPERSGTAMKRSAASPSFTHPLKKVRTTVEMREPLFFDNAEGVHYVWDEWLRNCVLNDVRKMCQNSLRTELPQSYFEFPGRVGREMTSEALSQLNSDYCVTWVGESVKYLLLIKAPQQVFFIDSCCSVFQANGMTFPNRRDPRRIHLTNTLVDGEMMLFEHKGKFLPRFLVQDVICINGEHVKNVHHERRMSLAKKEIIDPRVTALSNGIILRRKESELWLTSQPFWPISEAQKILHPERPSSPPNGLRFIRTNEDYKSQSLRSVLDWKRNRNVNFRIEVNQVKARAELFVLQSLVPFATTLLGPELEKSDGKIGQFLYDSPLKKWTFVKEASTHIPGSIDDAVAATSKKIDVVPVSKEKLLEAIQNNFSENRL